MRRIGRWLACAAVAAALGAVPAVAQQMAAPVDVQFSLFFRIFTYDRNLEQRASGGLVIGVLFQPDVRASVLAKNEAMRQQPPSGAGFAVRMVPIPLGDGTDVDSAAASAGCNVLYVTPLRAVSVGAIARASRGRGILTLTGVPEYIPEGIAVGIGLRGDRPEILVNLGASRQQGADFSAQLLRLARVW